ncbi:MAG: hypothetical protein ACOYNY_37975 [Caldilineaceae bacterium]
MLTTKNFNQYPWLAGLCALITFLPVLNHCLAVPGEMLLTLAAWLLSNGIVSAGLFVYIRLRRTTPTHA